jgi:hypothetical protein
MRIACFELSIVGITPRSIHVGELVIRGCLTVNEVHMLDHVFICFSQHLVIDNNLIVKRCPTASDCREITVLKTLHSFREHSVVLAILDVFALNFLEVFGSLHKFMSLLSQLLFVLVFKLVYFFLKVNFLLVGSRHQSFGSGLVRETSDVADVLKDVLKALASS